MTIKAIYDAIAPNGITYGGVITLLVIVSLLVQISPLKLDPWSWIGDQLNKNIKKEISEMRTDVSTTEKKLDEHIAQSLRTKIINFQDDILQKGMLKTQAQWKEVQRACGEYEAYITANNLVNGDATEAIEFIHQEYQRCASTRNFMNSPVQKNDK